MDQLIMKLEEKDMCSWCDKAAILSWDNGGTREQACRTHAYYDDGKKLTKVIRGSQP